MEIKPQVSIFDNINTILKDDLEHEIKKGSIVNIAAACFSIYAYQELKKQLKDVEEFRFIFTSPTFTKEKSPKQEREFYIPRIKRESSLYGTEFEVKLRNEITQKAIAKECVDWIKKKATFKSNATGEHMGGFIAINSADDVAYIPFNSFTTADIGCEKGDNLYNMVTKLDAPQATNFLNLFNDLWNDNSKFQDVTDVIIQNISAAYLLFYKQQGLVKIVKIKKIIHFWFDPTITRCLYTNTQRRNAFVLKIPFYGQPLETDGRPHPVLSSPSLLPRARPVWREEERKWGPLTNNIIKDTRGQNI